MTLTPYDNFKEWEKDMDRIRAHPNDPHLIKHVRERVNVSSDSIQRQVYEYLQDMAFAQNPILIGQQIAKRGNQLLFVRSQDDPWWHV